MGDHFVLLVDRLITESTLEAAIGGRNSLKEEATETRNYSSDGPRKIVECRICQDEDLDLNMEAPCSCSGSLKYAHRKCIQRWCNEKGDTICEICLAQFKPGYTAPPPIFQLRRLPVSLRGNWRVARRDSNNPHIITMVSTDHELLDPDYDEYAVATSRSIVCCRTVAIILMILLIIRHTLPAIVKYGQDGSYPSALVMLLMLRIVGIVLPICIILKAVTSALSRQLPVDVSEPELDEEIGPVVLNQTHVVAIQ